MKKLIMTVLVGALVFGAFGVVNAVLIDPYNTRPVADAGDLSDVQGVLDSYFGVGVVSATNDQSTVGMWRALGFVNQSIAPTLLLEAAGQAPNNVFGIWFGSDSASIYKVPIFSGDATAPDVVSLLWTAPNTLRVGPSTYWTDPLITPYRFGFYLERPGDFEGGALYFTVDMLNPNGAPQALAYNDGSTNWIVAFEDLPYATTDRDYNDMVVKIESIAPVPEPMTMLLLGTGLVGIAGASRRRFKK